MTQVMHHAHASVSVSVQLITRTCKAERNMLWCVNLPKLPAFVFFCLSLAALSRLPVKGRLSSQPKSTATSASVGKPWPSSDISEQVASVSELCRRSHGQFRGATNAQQRRPNWDQIRDRGCCLSWVQCSQGAADLSSISLTCWVPVESITQAINLASPSTCY